MDVQRPKTIRFRGAVYRVATLPDESNLWRMRAKIIELVDSLGHNGVPRYEGQPKFLQLNDGWSFVRLLIEMNNRVARSGEGETPANYDMSVGLFQRGIDEVITGKLVSTLKQIRSLYQKLEQYPRILWPKGMAIPQLPMPMPKLSERVDSTKASLTPQALSPPNMLVPASVMYRGAKYRLALVDIIPLKFFFRDRVYVPAVKLLRKLSSDLEYFRVKMDKRSLHYIEEATVRLVDILEGGVLVLGQVMTQEKEFRQEAGEIQQRDDVIFKQRLQRTLLENITRLRGKGFLNPEEFPLDLDPQSMDEEALYSLEALLQKPLSEERDGVTPFEERHKKPGRPRKTVLVRKTRPE